MLTFVLLHNLECKCGEAEPKGQNNDHSYLFLPARTFKNSSPIDAASPPPLIRSHFPNGPFVFAIALSPSLDPLSILFLSGPNLKGQRKDGGSSLSSPLGLSICSFVPASLAPLFYHPDFPPRPLLSSYVFPSRATNPLITSTMATKSPA